MKTTGEKIKISELEEGLIIWEYNPTEEYDYEILGITGCTLDKKYYDMYCLGIYGNSHDYLLVKEGNEENE